MEIGAEKRGMTGLCAPLAVHFDLGVRSGPHANSSYMCLCVCVCMGVCSKESKKWLLRVRDPARTHTPDVSRER